MENNAVVVWIGVVMMRIPGVRRPMDLDISPECARADTDEGIEEIRTGILVKRAVLNDTERQTGAGRETRSAGDAGFPDSAKHLFRQTRHLHEVLLPADVDLIAERESRGTCGVCKVFSG